MPQAAKKYIAKFIKPLALAEIPGQIFITFDTCSSREPDWMEHLGPLVSRVETNENLRAGDAGEQRVSNLECVSAENLIRGLVANGYKLVGLKRVNKRTKVQGQLGHLKVSFIFSKEGDAIEEHQAVKVARRELARQTWSYLHVWINPGEFGHTATINFIQPQGDRAAKHSYAIEDGEFVARVI